VQLLQLLRVPLMSVEVGREGGGGGEGGDAAAAGAAGGGVGAAAAGADEVCEPGATDKVGLDRKRHQVAMPKGPLPVCFVFCT
jgi:hypothetical protein